MNKLLLTGLVASLMGLFITPSNAQTTHINHSVRADSHAPIGIMRDHMHEKGEWMLSYRYMHMDMGSTRSGTSDLSPETIVTTSPNRFFGNPMQPATLRVVPTSMISKMHMLGGMYAPSDKLTLMLMGNYIEREMNHITFQGMTGTTRLGTFKSQSKGWGDTKIGGLIRLFDDDMHHAHLNVGISLPTGSIKEEDNVLSPMNTRPRMRMAYGMQLGSGTYDFLPGITYSGHANKWGWGAQYAGTLRLGQNSENYSLGNKHQLSAWGSYSIIPAISFSARLTGETESQIDGIDSQIMAPSQAADPDSYGGKRVSTSLGINTVIPNGTLKGHRFSIEGTAPIYQNLNGPQLKRDYSLTVGWTKSF